MDFIVVKHRGLNMHRVIETMCEDFGIFFHNQVDLIQNILEKFHGDVHIKYTQRLLEYVALTNATFESKITNV